MKVIYLPFYIITPPATNTTSRPISEHWIWINCWMWPYHGPWYYLLFSLSFIGILRKPLTIGKGRESSLKNPLLFLETSRIGCCFESLFMSFNWRCTRSSKVSSMQVNIKLTRTFFFRNSIIYLFVFLFCFVFFMCELKVVGYIENHLLKKTDVYFYECLTYSWEYTMFLLRKQIYPVC